MPVILFSGDVSNASGAATILSVSSDNFDFSDTFDGTFSKKLTLPIGDFVVIVNCLTDGEMDFNVTGNFTSINPNVPEKFDNDKTGNLYDLTV